MSEHKLKIGITQGDPNGIGWEVILKALADPRMTELATPVVYGSPAAAAFYRQTLADTEPAAMTPVPSAREARRGRVNLVAVGETTPQPGKPTPEGARAAVEALRRAMSELKEGLLDALVTAPFDKETVQAGDFRFTGHTEYLAAEAGEEAAPMMILSSDVLRVGLVTKHIPVAEISRSLTREKIAGDLQTLRRSLVADFGIVAPRIAVMALNPHAGDGGLAGREEAEIIRPAIDQAFAAGILAFGPFAADGLFGGGAYARYDGILAMYHDQGLAPFKALTPYGVNFTANLPFVRTSPDHGTAFDIAGRDKADPQSMRNAIFAAIDIVERRRAWARWTADPLQHAERERERPGREGRDNRDNRERRDRGREEHASREATRETAGERPEAAPRPETGRDGGSPAAAASAADTALRQEAPARTAAPAPDPAAEAGFSPIEAVAAAAPEAAQAAPESAEVAPIPESGKAPAAAPRTPDEAVESAEEPEAPGRTAHATDTEPGAQADPATDTEPEAQAGPSAETDPPRPVQ